MTKSTTCLQKNNVFQDLLRVGLLIAMCFGGFAPAFGEGLAIGITEPHRQTSLSPAVQGTIAKILVAGGDYVQPGETLLELDHSIENLERERKRIILEDQSELREVKVRIAVLKKQVTEGRVLSGTGAISIKQLEDEELALSAAEAQRDSLNAVKKQAEIDHKLASQYYRQKILTAPMAGVVTLVNGEVGETVRPQEILVKIVDVSKIRFVGTFPLSQDYRFKVGDETTIRLMQHGELIERQAIVTYVSPLADAASGLRELFAEVDNSDLKIIPGTAAELRPVIQKLSNE